MERGNQKYRGLAEFPSHARQPQAGLTVSMSMMCRAVTYRPVRMLASIAIGETFETTS